MKRMMKMPFLLLALVCLLGMTACNPKETISNNKTSGATEHHSANMANRAVNTNAANSLVSSNTNTNQNQNATSVQCALTKAPMIKGFTLGETPEDIDRKIPGFKAAYDGEKAKSIAREKKANFVVITSGSRFLQDTNINVREYADTTLIWHFLDDKLMALVVKDTSEESAGQGILDFLSEAAAKYNLPKEGWKLGKGQDADITCQGFEISVTAGGQPGMSVMITDTEARKEKQKRQA